MLLRSLFLDLLGIHNFQINAAVVGSSCMTERLVDALVGILQLHIFSDHSHLHTLRGMDDRVHDFLPFPHIGWRRIEPQ